MKNFPSFSQWKQIFKVLTRSEKIVLLVCFVLALGSFIFLASTFYINNTNVAADFGGTYIEGVVGQPRFINPIYGEADDVDRSIIDLVYSGLMTYDKQGNIVPDLAQNYTVSGDGKTYTFNLKNNVFWSDGQPLTASDVVFTVKTIQNSDYNSPLRANWIDVDVQQLSNTSVQFTLKQPYNSFLENCTLKIIPQHIWQNISPENFALSIYNLQPVGSGPFEFSSLQQDKTGFIENLNLQSNRRYYAKPSFISMISFKFFDTMQDLTASANARTIDGFTLSTLDTNEAALGNQINQGWSASSQFSLYPLLIPRYFAVFFNNQTSSIFSDVNVRQALSYATDKSQILQTISGQTHSTITSVDSPILPDFYGYQAPTTTYGFDASKAASLLDASGFKDNGLGQREKAINKKPAFQFTSYLKLGSKGTQVTELQSCLAQLPSAVRYTLNGNFSDILKNETNGVYGQGTQAAVNEFQKEYLPNLKPTGETGASTRQELNKLCASPTQNSKPLAFTLVTINQPQLVEVANMLKADWANIGVSVTINAVSLTDLKPIIKDRNYDALLYGETLGMQPDLYPFWYSSQKQDPGLNLSSYQNKQVDQLLTDARQTLDPNQKQQDFQQLQNLIIADAPALFLYNPDYIYWVSNKVSGIDTTKIADPAKRFENITSWYIDTKRVWK